MKLLWCLLFIGFAAAEVSEKTEQQLAEAVIANYLPTEVFELYKAAVKIDKNKLKKLDDGLECATMTEEVIIKKTTELSAELGEKTKAVLAYYKKKYDAIGAEGKKFLNELKTEFCAATEEKDETKMQRMFSNIAKAAIGKYLTLPQTAQDEIEKQFPAITLVKHAVIPQPKEKIQAALISMFPKEQADFLKALLGVDSRKLLKLAEELQTLDCTADEETISNKIKEVSPELAESTKNLYDQYKKNYEALGANGKKFFDGLESKVCDLYKEPKGAKKGRMIQEALLGTAMQYMSLDEATQADIEKQFPSIALAKSLFNYYIEKSISKKMSPKFRI